MKSSRAAVKNFLYSTFFFIIFYDCFAVVASPFGLPASVIYALMGAVALCWVMLALRLFVKNFWLFVAAHIALVAATLFVPAELAAKVILCLLTAACAVFSIHDRTREFKEGISAYTVPLACALNLALYLAVTLGIKRTDITNIFPISPVILLVLWLFHTQMFNFDTALAIAADTHVTPMKKLRRFNNAAAIALAAAALVVVGLALALRAQDGLSFLLKELQNFWWWLVSHQKPDTGAALPTPILSTPEPLQGIDLSQIVGDDKPVKPMPPWVDFLLSKVLPTLIALGILCLIIYGVYLVYKKFYAQRNSDGDVKEFVAPETFKDRSSAVKFFRRFLPTWSNDNAGKARKLFYKKITAHVKRGASVKRNDTPDEIAEKIKSREDISLLANIYDKARYSNEEITDEELKTL